ncbi:MAG: primosomal protein N' [Lachnospiraceae bacterium]|nr:primosomal protein N' [Lachnospiraceae bacterium]
MKKYALIIIDIAYTKLDRPFTYRIPQEMRDRVVPGSIVTVPFGRANTLRKGYVIGLSDRSELPDAQIKEIAELQAADRSGACAAETAGSREDGADGDFWVGIAAWMSERYGSTMAVALRTVLSSGKPGKPAVHREIELRVSMEDAAAMLEAFEKKHQVARARLLRELMKTPRQPYALVVSKLHIQASTVRAMRAKGILEVTEEQVLRNPVSLGEVREDRKQLSPQQQEIADSVVRDFDTGRGGVSLIRGITGSGKTEVYIAIIREIVARGRQAVMLIPEIALTYQTLLRFYQYFGDRVSVMNSSLSESEKADQRERARRGEIDVIIGPRSALFTPFPHIGVIVIDEEHESSYKNESMPKYRTADVAAEIARRKGAVVVLGSATPSLVSYERARRGEYRLYELDRRLTGGTLPQVYVADLREELRSGNRSILSRKLASLLEDRLEKGEQSMLFLNRRGTAGFVSCRSCGHVMKCPHCDVSLSLHRGGRLTCHYCGYTERMPERCPECGSPYISGFRAGTEQVEAYLHKVWPQARILRLDADTTSRKGSYEKILSAFANEEADILVGTQMIVKGHDFPGVTLVGALLADLSLYAGDYRSAERTFQLLTQAAGRAGRGTRPGEVVIQTYQPEHYAIRYAAAQDHQGFCGEEMLYRSALLYPPAGHMLAVQIQSEQEDAALSEAGRARELLSAKEGNLFLIGPAAAQISRIRDTYRFVLYIKDTDYDRLIRCKDLLEADLAERGAAGGVPPVNYQFDFDPESPY